MRRYLVCVGGLGNQLFIWNAAHTLVNNGFKITILVPKDSDRRNELSELIDICSHGIVLKESILIFRILQVFEYVLWKFPGSEHLHSKFGLLIYGHPNDPISIESKKVAIYKGYFQNLEMVESNKAVVLSELLRFSEDRIKSVRNRIQLPSKYDAFHIRRGDLKQNLESIGVLSDQYYMNQQENDALVITTEKMTDLTRDFNAVFISTEENSSNWESFAILCHASKLVTANSTFSWWAGMVAKYRDSNCVVTQPDRYYKKSAEPNFLRVNEFLQVKAIFL